ncbi:MULTISPECIES: amidohydrolase [unclassified Paenibacillus]|uniref:amidohydrolase family protein n=1 Tax=unclassified Paenibacillus TaxID=185978 RepID=UPI00277F5B84|nr:MULTISPECIES: amidohydrolase family protein [unclassified Paenibacillus]MDQ0897878.1 L-fuconolactonase [Paenibacillus sp. V4I7]MDQ0916126.1 L-fuconolactonase [Paenibacillus sp. V4I5]
MTSIRQSFTSDVNHAYLDSHVHFWRLERGDYHWLTPSNPVLYQNYVPSDLFGLEDANALRGIIAVQAAPTIAETEYLLELAGENERILGVVGWLDPFADSFADEYRRLRNNLQFVGIRLDRSVFVPNTEQVSDRLLKHLRLLEEDAFPIDLLIGPENMPTVIKYLKSVPNLKAVINHLGGPPIRTGEIEQWSAYIDELSAFPNVYCKWSGMITPAGGMNPHLLAPYIRHTAERFGPNRIMFGSDWPVALMAGTYNNVVQFFEQLLPKQWSDEERANVRMHNAKVFYFGNEDSEA